MKFRLLLFLVLFGHNLSAQLFVEHPLTPPFESVAEGSTAYADIDNDGDQDVLITGSNVSGERISTLYINTGTGSYRKKVGTPFEGVINSTVTFSDVDGDHDQDLLITGRNVSNGRSSILYLNNGQGDFSEVLDTPFTGVSNGFVSFADFDGDNDQDLLITGDLSSSFRSTDLFLNDGLGNFTEKPGTLLDHIKAEFFAVSDINEDTYPDILVYGEDIFGLLTSKLYINDGQGDFVQMGDTPFLEGTLRSIFFSDMDGDEDQDLVVLSNDGTPQSLKLFLNDGAGIFIRDSMSIADDMVITEIELLDINEDQEKDMVIAGYIGVTSDNNFVQRLYLNDGQGSFLETTNPPFDNFPLQSISMASEDVDNDGDPDFLLAGKIDNIPYSRLYLNDGQGNFTNPFIPFVDVALSASTFADIDGDGDEDVFITGTISGTSSLVDYANLYLNDGQGNFSEVLNAPFPGVANGAVEFADIDGDNDLDLLIMGNSVGVRLTKLYTNDGQGNFSEVLNTPFINVTRGDLAFSDVDGDNDLDVLISGEYMSGIEITRLYLNDGNGIFSQSVNNQFTEVYSGKVVFSDVDGDGDEDLLVTGLTIDNGVTHTAKLYINDGQGVFTELLDTPITPVSASSVAFSDIDGDSDNDILIVGNIGSMRSAKIYINDGLAGFTEQMDTPFQGVSSGTIDFADVDNDGDEDVILTGLGESLNVSSRLYMNDGVGNFSEVTDTPFIGVRNSSVAFSDIDSDNDLDVLITGSDQLENSISKLYLNQLFSPANDINGFCFYDVNENQQKDADEDVLYNQIIQITPNPLLSYTTGTGQFRFFVDNGSYQLTALPDQNWRLTTDSIVEVNLQGIPEPNINFGFVPNEITQLVRPDISSAPTRCSFDVRFWLTYQNTGTINEDGYLELALSEDVILQEYSLPPDGINNNKLRWYFNDLAISESKLILLTLKMPDASNVGDSLDFTATTFLIDTNLDTLENSIYHYNPILTCAVDPNDKAVLPAGVGDENLTLFDSEFEYRIRFQNTGNDTAFTVRIEDDLDPNLDWNTFRPISASHPYEVDMDLTSGRVTFLFRNILLPDSIVNEPLSHGFVKYKISPLSGLSEETQITNEAGIFFDFNEPIWTNTTLNTMVSMLTNTEEALLSTELTVIPNPFQKTTIFRIKDIPGNRGSLNIYDTNGVLIFSETVASNTDVTFRKEGLASGIYFYEVVDQKGRKVFSGKVIKY